VGRRAPAAEPRWPEQRDAFALLGLRATDLKRWIGCSYARAHALRQGDARLRGEELRNMAAHSPVSARYLTRHMAPLDVRRQQLALVDEDQGDET
jgi:hypothetical protein